MSEHLLQPKPNEQEQYEICHEADGKQIIIDWARTEEVLGNLMQAYEERQFPYNLDSTRVPHDPRHMPETMPRGGTEHAMFLWTTCYYMRGGTKSVDAFKKLSVIYDEQPELFVASQAAATEQETIEAALKGVGLGFQRTVSNAWVENARRLEEEWEGDPRNLFTGVNTYEEALARIQNKNGSGFIGFQEKMVSMITYYLMDEKLIDMFNFPLPVDLHVLRVSIANELIRFEGYAEDENLYSAETLAAMRKLYYTYAKKHFEDPLRLCDAVWLLSEALCGKQPGNITLEPNGRKNRNGRKTLLVPLPIDFDSPSQQKGYAESCAECPINDTCEWNVPGKVYYVQGELKRRGRREVFPEPEQNKLFAWHEGKTVQVPR